MESTRHDWSVHVGSWQFGLVEKDGFFSEKRFHFTTIHIGPYTKLFNDTTAPKVACWLGGAVLAVAFVIVFLFVRFTFKSPARSPTR